MVRVYHTFSSIQGESTTAGLPCHFIRLAGCPLSCSYCDTRNACESAGEAKRIDEILDGPRSAGIQLVEVTGGEPLVQADTFPLLTALCDSFETVLLETSGGVSIKGVDPRVRIIMDVKCPGSGMSHRMLPENLERIRDYRRELKFVVRSKGDFEWAVQFAAKNRLEEEILLVSPVLPDVSPRDLAAWVLASPVRFRMQLQLHKIIWPEGGEDR